MSSFQWLRFLTIFLYFSADGRVVAQPLGANPSAAASDVRNPSSTNPSAAASDIRNPSATNPSAAASQIPQPSAISSRRDNVTPSIGSQRIAPQTRRARAVQQGHRERVKSRDATAGVEMTRPFEALEGARRDRIEFEKRAANDKVQQQRMEKEQKAKQAGEKRSEATAKRAQGARPAPTTAPSEKTIPPSPAGQHSAPKP
jgi:hypothetical protein